MAAVSQGDCLLALSARDGYTPRGSCAIHSLAPPEAELRSLDALISSSP